MKALFLENLPYRGAIRVGSHHYADGFAAEGADVMWVSHPLSPLHLLHRGTRDRDERLAGWRHGPRRQGAVRYYSPMTLLPATNAPVLRSRAVVRASARACVPGLPGVLEREGFGAPDLIWLTNPIFTPVATRLERRCLAYRIADDHTAFAGVPDAFAELEADALSAADVVFAVAHRVAERLAERGVQATLLPNGVDYAFFAEPRIEPDDLAEIPHPRAIYVGAVEYWFDAELVAATAASRPDVHFVIVGPESPVTDPLRALGNVHVLGPRPYAQVPAYLHACDAAVIPFVRSELIDAVHPVKLYEYLATGLPVVAVTWDELERIGAPATLVSRADFADALATAIDAGRDSGAEERRAFAAANSWEARFAIVRERVDAVLGEAPDA